MPPTIKRKRTESKGTTRPAVIARASRPTSAVSRNPGQIPMPNRIQVRHRFCYQAVLNAGTAAPSGLTIKLNGLFSPVGTSQQPMGFDQFAALYQNFRVVGTRVSALFGNQGNTPASDYQVVGIQAHENSSWAPGTAGLVIERGRCVFDLLSLANGKGTTKLQMSWNPMKWYGPDNYQGGDTAGTNSADPSQLCYATVFVAGEDVTQNPAAVSALIVVDYDAEWFTPIQMDAS